MNVIPHIAASHKPLPALLAFALRHKAPGLGWYRVAAQHRERAFWNSSDKPAVERRQGIQDSLAPSAAQSG